jgi:hypothetical protein
LLGFDRFFVATVSAFLSSTVLKFFALKPKYGAHCDATLSAHRQKCLKRKTVLALKAMQKGAFDLDTVAITEIEIVYTAY